MGDVADGSLNNLFGTIKMHEYQTSAEQRINSSVQTNLDNDVYRYRIQMTAILRTI